ncbi:V-type ATP synthase subunit I [Streptococcus henryi]|uniref:V-type ATP synthase subunit I n=1 Tax=Streptococcus henryi TaxID=439219 RepID=UPI000379845E|nr:V-type ATP synthase subunit I [Streptococcus henryi]
MAISQMKKISIVFSKENLDPVLLALQESETVEVREIAQMTNWQEAFEEEKVDLPLIHQIDAKTQEVLAGEEALSYLSRRQQTLENTIEKLRHFIPKEGMIQALKKEDYVLSFEELEQFGQDNSAEDLIDQVTKKISRVYSLERKIGKNESEIASLTKWKNLEVTPKELRQFDFIRAVIGTIPKTEDDNLYRLFKANEAIEVQEIFNSEIEYGVLTFFDAKADINLHDYGFKAFDYDKDILPAQAISQMQAKNQDWSKEKDSLIEELKGSQQALQDLEVQTDYVLGLYNRQEVKKHLASTKHLVALEGWVQENEVALLRNEITSQFGDSVYVQELDVAKEDWDQVPIKLKNHPLVEPFELVTEMYSLPKYNEKDPTPFLAPFYFVFFGMMVADLGYGLLMFVGTLLALKSFNLNKGMARFMRFFNLLGIAVSLWGLVYGSFFGADLPFHLLSTTNDVMTILMLSVVFGFITVLFGMILGGLQNLRMKDYAEAYNSGFAWVGILGGIAMLAVGTLLPSLSFLVSLGAILAIINAIGILVVSVIQSKGLGGLGSGLFNLYNISSYAGDLVSFTRLMALGLSGASIGQAFNLIVGIFPTGARFTIGIVVFVVLHAINIFLSLLSGYVHGARLMFVEFFGKFYTGGGRAFAPLKSAEKYIKIKK